MNAEFIAKVWAKFVDWCAKVVPAGKIGCIVAWNGKGSDMKWLWDVSEETYSPTCKMHAQLEYFMDPMSVIKKYSTCNLCPLCWMVHMILCLIHKHSTMW
jgi:hypothetical protein